ncbi:unnamed protein product [Meganyctiphanes norvegica]|uniref:C2H2-type domain-containing protein n=1 Tax=Meganyctiphanes norvegica TaxID=48144 RepID=A0AAV2RU05_MEGNR
MNQVSIYKVLEISKDEKVNVKVKNEIEIKDEPLYTRDIETNVKESSIYCIVREKIEDIELKVKPIQIQDVDMQIREENVKYEEPVSDTTECYQVKHQRADVGYKLHHGSHSDDSYLISHLKTHPVDKQYQCSQCDTAFPQKGYIICHQKINTGEKPYKCKQCDKDFSQSYYLKIHMRKHTGEKTYKCNQCNKAFAWKTNLIRHQIMHSGEKPYQCSQCDKAFSLSI